MDGWIDGWMNGWMDGLTDRWMSGWMDGQIDRHIMDIDCVHVYIYTQVGTLVGSILRHSNSMACWCFGACMIYLFIA